MKSQKNEIQSDFKGGIFIMKQIDWEKIRQEEFPILNTMTFLDVACVSFAPQRAVVLPRQLLP